MTAASETSGIRRRDINPECSTVTGGWRKKPPSKNTSKFESLRMRRDFPVCLYATIWQIMIRPFRGLHPQIHPTAFVDPSAQVIGEVQLGEESSVWCNCTIRGDIHFIRIGDRSNVQDNSVIHVRNGTHPTILEQEVTVGHSVTLHGCYVERGCLIGIGSILLDDVRIGADSLVAAGSLVSPGTVIPPRSLVMGFPARVKRQLADDEVLGLTAFWKNYVDYTREYLQEESRG
jgi:carbonic anhydrase/acetyltransferase-like protein (isoleucine patch superfamily)